MIKKYIQDTKNYYTEYFIDDTPRPTIVVSPGGGYQYTSPRESKPVADVFNQYGYHVVVVNYRETKEDIYPKPSSYLADVLHLIKKDKRATVLIGMGFSAGGHNLLEVSLHSKDYGENVTPDLLILGYPVVTTDERYWHKNSFVELLGEKFEQKELRSYLSMETQVNENAPDLFLWGTFTDQSVDVMNSLLLIEAYRKHHCNVEYHMFPRGGHGLSVCNKASAEDNLEKIDSYVGKWTELAKEWIEEKIKRMYS